MGVVDKPFGRNVVKVGRSQGVGKKLLPASREYGSAGYGGDNVALERRVLVQSATSGRQELAEALMEGGHCRSMRCEEEVGAAELGLLQKRPLQCPVAPPQRSRGKAGTAFTLYKLWPEVQQ